MAPASKSQLGYYNGYSPGERVAKLQAMHKKWPGRTHPYYRGRCHMCGDPTSPVSPHDEDYGLPYRWQRPAMYALCRQCHQRLHRRFKSPMAWEAYKRHLARGGYGSDLQNGSVARQLASCAAALTHGDVFPLAAMRRRAVLRCWWDQLSPDPLVRSIRQLATGGSPTV